MSLLLCFFVMLFSMSIIAERRFQALADAIQIDIKGYADSGKTKSKVKGTTPTPVDSAAKSMRIFALQGGLPRPGPEGESTEIHTILRDGVTVRGGVIRFEFGRDELTVQARQSLEAIHPILEGSPNKIMIKGYAIPSEAGIVYQQTDDLAFYRALAVVDFFVESGLQRDFFEIVVDLATVPALNLLPPGTEPSLAGATAEIILLNQTLRTTKGIPSP
jgi:flagellar motor protein MotB